MSRTWLSGRTEKAGMATTPARCTTGEVGRLSHHLGNGEDDGEQRAETGGHQVHVADTLGIGLGTHNDSWRVVVFVALRGWLESPSKPTDSVRYLEFQIPDDRIKNLTKTLRNNAEITEHRILWRSGL
jgi:hypothetical protein